MKAYSKKLPYGAIRAHFIVQPSKYAQRMLGTVKAPSAKAGYADFYEKARWEEGKTLAMFRGGKDTAFKVLDQLAGAITEHIRLGVIHHDLHPFNILLLRKKALGRKVPVLKIIDYGRAKAVTHGNVGYADIAEDYEAVRKKVIPFLSKRSRTKKERLNDYFERRFLEKIAHGL